LTSGTSEGQPQKGLSALVSLPKTLHLEELSNIEKLSKMKKLSKLEEPLPKSLRSRGHF
jgi:hypothetical protein